MSFILDALKKSETDRQQQSNTEFAGVPTNPGKTAVPRWFWVVGVLLAINLAVLAGLLLQPAAVPPPAVPDHTANSILPTTRTDAAPSFEEKVATAQRNPPEQQPDDAGVIVETPATTMVQSVLISQDPSAVPATDRYPSIQEVRASGSSGLPELHLDIHVYSSEPAARFVFINMVKQREGSRLKEGPQVVEITPNGVVLEYQGQMFLLPRDQ
jgi:general secretion pathway protein B